jgi:hypothetical protein
MSDPFDPSEHDPATPVAHDDEQEGSFPWEAELPPDDPDAPRQRHDAFTERRKHEFLRALVKTGCIEDACRLTGVGRRTVYRHQEDSPSFFDHCCTALRMSGTPLELTAWQRAVDGVEEKFVVAGKVEVRTRYSEGMLRMLLQGSNPRKYGPRPGFKRKRLLKHERKQMEREIRAELNAKMEEKRMSFDEAVDKLDRQITAMALAEEPQKFAAGWTKSPDGHWIPPGYGPLPGWSGGSAASGEEAWEEETPRDSM